MLILTRTVGQAVMVGDTTVVRVAEVQGGRVSFDVQTETRTGKPIRQVGEEFEAEPATVTVLGIRGAHQVRLGFRAPREVAVHREEIYERIKAEEGQPA